MLYAALFVATLISYANSQNCTALGASYTDNQASTYPNHGDAQYVVDIWNAGAFVLPFPIEDESGTAMCHKAGLIGTTTVRYSCVDDTTIQKEEFTNGACTGTAANTYTWTAGWTPELNPAMLPNLVPMAGSGFMIPVGIGSGNLFDFSCTGDYAAAEIEIGVLDTCVGATTIHGAIGAGCLGTNEATANLLVSCDCDGSYINTFYSYNDSISLTVDNVCMNSGMTNFVCDQYTAVSTCGFLLYSEAAGTNLYGRTLSCSACPTTTDTPTPTDSMAVNHSFSLLVFAVISLFTVFFQ